MNKYASPLSEHGAGFLYRVTDLRPDKRAPSHLIIEINGFRFASLPGEVVASLGLHAESVLTEEAHERLSQIAEAEAAHRVAVRMLAAKPRAINELLRKLRERGHNASAAAEAVGRLEDSGLLNDEEFAGHFAVSRVAKGHGSARIVRDLLVRGVDRRAAERAVGAAWSDEGVDELQQARKLAMKRSVQLGDLPRDKKFRRILQYLGRRGYRGREVTEMVQEVIAG